MQNQIKWRMFTGTIFQILTELGKYKTSNAGLYAHTSETTGIGGKERREQGRRDVSLRNGNWKIEKSNVLLKIH